MENITTVISAAACLTLTSCLTGLVSRVRPTAQPIAPCYLHVQACLSDATKRGDIDVVICDTAGRLHTAYGLMEELTRCQKAVSKASGAGGCSKCSTAQLLSEILSSIIIKLSCDSPNAESFGKDIFSLRLSE